MTQKRQRNDGEQQVLLICHRSERSEVKRSCESMGASSTCNDEGEGRKKREIP
ncbi:MAG: hypothetical protein NC218_12400 [Acetobacter sp.]|nr:hypothetical protein [Acetobacter sp.]